MKPITVYAINLPKRQDRLRSILQQSRGKSYASHGNAQGLGPIYSEAVTPEETAVNGG